MIVTAEGPVPTMFIPDDDAITKVLLDWNPEQVLELAATGTGCLLVHRTVLQDMFDKSGGSKNCWFGFDIRTGKSGLEWALGEDVSFCLRAGEAGWRTYVDTTAQVGHHKGPKVWWPSSTKETPASLPQRDDDGNSYA